MSGGEDNAGEGREREKGKGDNGQWEGRSGQMSPNLASVFIPKAVASQPIKLVHSTVYYLVLISATYGPSLCLVFFQEFLAKKSVESARVGRKSVVFRLEVETIMIRFQEEETAKKFTQMINSIR